MDTFMTNAVQGVEDAIDYHFAEPLILWEALQAPGNGLRSEGTRSFPDGNKRLALVGDAVLKLALLEEWYAGTESRETGSNILGSVAVNANLDRVARQHSLDRFVSRHISQSDNVPPRIMTATLEGIIGGVWLDSGKNISAVKNVMLTLGLVSN